MSHYRNFSTNNRSTQTREAKSTGMFRNDCFGQGSMARASLDPGKLDWIDWQTRMVQRLEKKYGSRADYNSYVKRNGCRYNPITCLQQPLDATFCSASNVTQQWAPAQAAACPCPCPPPRPTFQQYQCIPPIAPACQPRTCFAPTQVGTCLACPAPCAQPCALYAPPAACPPTCPRPCPPPRKLARKPPFETRTVSRLSYVPMPYTRQPTQRPPEMLRIPAALTSTTESVYTRSYMPVVDLSSCRRVPVRHTDNLPLTPLPQTPMCQRTRPAPCGNFGGHY